MFNDALNIVWLMVIVTSESVCMRKSLPGLLPGSSQSIIIQLDRVNRFKQRENYISSYIMIKQISLLSI